MELFVNRASELQLIDDAFSTLLDRKRLLRTPIIEVYGTRGIGKTSLLKQVQQRCHDTQLPYIWVDIKPDPSIERQIIVQVKKYIQIGEEEDQPPVQATGVLLQQGPVVMLFDSIEAANAEQLKVIETLLSRLIDDEKLFVILAGKKVVPFPHEHSVARKLSTLQLKTLDKENCDFYLDQQSHHIEPEVRDIIFEWTRGYPLAMKIMIEAVGSGLDPRTEQGKRETLTFLTDQLINQEVLVNIKAEERSRYFSALQLFSVPRRFNLVLAQDLIEKFTPELKRESPMAYFGLPKEIGEATDVLSWNMARAGFSVDAPIRTIFLQALKIEQPERYVAIHEFLAHTNIRLAAEVPGTDRVRYIRECIYHTASTITSQQMTDLLDKALDSSRQESPENFLQFSEEFSQDEELQEALGEHLPMVQATISTHLAEINSNLSEG